MVAAAAQGLVIQVVLYIHALVQDSDHIEDTVVFPVENDVAPDCFLSVARANFAYRASEPRVSPKHVEHVQNLANIALSLGQSPTNGRVVPNLYKVRFCLAPKPILHGRSSYAQ